MGTDSFRTVGKASYRHRRRPKLSVRVLQHITPQATIFGEDGDIVVLINIRILALERRALVIITGGFVFYSASFTIDVTREDSSSFSSIVLLLDGTKSMGLIS